MRRKKLLRDRSQALPCFRCAQVSADGEKTRENAGDVAVKRSERPVERDAENGRGGIVADARQREGAGERGRELRVVLGDDLPRGPMEIARAAVIAEPGPVFQNFGFARAGQLTDGGEAREEAFIIGQHSGDARLLEHDFGEPDAVGIAPSAPGKVAAIDAIPGEKFAAEGCELVGRESDRSSQGAGILA